MLSLLRWLVFDFMPLDIDVTFRERKEIQIRAMLRPGSSKRLFSAMLAGSVLIGPIPPIMMILFPSRSGYILALMVLFALIWIVAALGFKWALRPAILCVLQEHGYFVCQNCGYFLRGLGEAELFCPECGSRFLNGHQQAERCPDDQRESRTQRPHAD